MIIREPRDRDPCCKVLPHGHHPERNRPAAHFYDSAPAASDAVRAVDAKQQTRSFRVVPQSHRRSFQLQAKWK